MPDSKPPSSGDQEEQNKSAQEELAELLQELRVILPGVQVLFAFLLTVPFTQRFQGLSPHLQGVFFAALLCTAISTVLLLAPTAHHRILWRRHLREQRMLLGNTLTTLGLVFLVLAILGVLFVVTGILFGLLIASVVTGLFTTVVIGLWGALPIWYGKR